ncbi:hypothetical protein Y1Q_0007182 [Alligator mississippiensis]|uniref:Uncharacterized protein n=1 Tax=Alligator mississippiensis TaxID=8496 RepID=A0A151N5W0_ALLMI|nr:hypothetical protein Y1Q_0007182 [Alligator mississippiensis]
MELCDDILWHDPSLLIVGEPCKVHRFLLLDVLESTSPRVCWNGILPQARNRWRRKDAVPSTSGESVGQTLPWVKWDLLCCHLVVSLVRKAILCYQEE